MMRLALRPIASGGIRDPRRLGGPLGSKDCFRGSGVFSLTTAILGASGVLICGRLGLSYTNDKFQATEDLLLTAEASVTKIMKASQNQTKDSFIKCSYKCFYFASEMIK